jgi:2-octaprenylphenol hydroxylase
MPTPPNSSSQAARPFDAIVVGAGIVGLCAAALLGRKHKSVALVAPAAPAFKPSGSQRFDPRVYAISGKSQRFLADIKAWDALPADRVTAVTGMDIWGDDTRNDALTLRARDSGVDAVTWIVEQQSLLDALDMVAKFTPGLTRIVDRMESLTFVGNRGAADQWPSSQEGASFTDSSVGSSAHQNSAAAAANPFLGGSSPAASFSAGSPARLWRLQTAGGDVLEAPVVVAADGANSAVRAAALLDFPVEDYNALGVVATFRQERPHDGVARQWFLGSSVLALLPLPDQCVSMVWSVDAHQHALWQREDSAAGLAHISTPGNNADPAARAESAANLSANATHARTSADNNNFKDALRMARRVMQAADGRVAEVTGRLDPCGELAAHPLRHGVAPLWFADGVVLLGDAAHLVHPLAGQGLNIGIEDVADFASVVDAGCSDTTLRAWQRTRKAGAQPIHWLTHGLNGLFRVDLPGAQWLRNTGMQMVNQVPALKRWLVGQAMR